MKTLLITLIITMPLLNAELSFLQAGQPNEQKKSVKEQSVSYSEAAYHMAEGAAITAACCLPSILCFKGFGFEAMYKSERDFADYDIYPICAGLLHASSGIPCIPAYALKIYNARRPEAVKKEYNQQLRTFTIEPVSDQDKLNACAKFTGSVLSILGMTLGYCYFVKFDN